MSDLLIVRLLEAFDQFRQTEGQSDDDELEEGSETKILPHTEERAY